MIHVSHLRPALLQPTTLVDLLRARASRQPNKTAFTFLHDGDTQASSLTYGELDRQARAIGALLQDMGAAGERVLLMYPSGLDYIAALFGCLYAGAIAVPAYPPRSPHSLMHIQTITADAGATIALTTTTLLAKMQQRFAWIPGLVVLQELTTDRLAAGLETTWHTPNITDDSLAFLHYTSRLTGCPRGVMLSHGTLLHHMQQLHHVFEQTEESVGVGWLPFHHDLGLLGNVLQPLYAGFPSILMSPMAFLQRPVRWLQAISRYRATTSGGANFAYDVCVRKITPAQRNELDLHSWEVALNGPEPVRHTTLARFASTFATCGFRREALYPYYGLAEATLMVSGGSKHTAPAVRAVQKTALEKHRQAIPCIGADGMRVLVSSGSSLPNQTIYIVNPETKTVCSPNEIGEIWVAGAGVASGYWNQPDATSNAFEAYIADTGEGPCLRTGDLGFIHRGELYVTGRCQHIVHDRRHITQALEATATRGDTVLRPDGGAAVARQMVPADTHRIQQDTSTEAENGRRELATVHASE